MATTKSVRVKVLCAADQSLRELMDIQAALRRVNLELFWARTYGLGREGRAMGDSNGCTKCGIVMPYVTPVDPPAPRPQQVKARMSRDTLRARLDAKLGRRHPSKYEWK